MSRFVTAEHPERGTLWAAIDPDAQFHTPQVGERRFVAFLTPFPSEAAATKALEDAGGLLKIAPKGGKR